MANPVIFPSNTQWLGMAKEATYGTAEAAPLIWVPVVDPKHTPGLQMLVDDALRGNMAAVQGQVLGPRSDTVTYKTYMYLDSLFPHVLGILGYADSVTGTTNPYTHTTSLINSTDGQPPSYTLWLFNGAETWQTPGCKVTGLDVDIKPDGLIEVTPSWQGLLGTKVSDPSNTPSTAAPMPGWNTTCTIAGTDTVATTMKLSLKRNDANPVWTLNGSQTPYEVFMGAFDISGEFTTVYLNYTGSPANLSNYLANTQPALTVKSYPAGDAVHYAQWTLTNMGYTGVEVSGQNGYMQADIKFQGIKNSTDGLGAGVSPVKFVLLNTVSAAY